jgi:hypothetical protein
VVGNEFEIARKMIKEGSDVAGRVQLIDGVQVIEVGVRHSRRGQVWENGNAKHAMDEGLGRGETDRKEVCMTAASFTWLGG